MKSGQLKQLIIHVNWKIASVARHPGVLIAEPNIPAELSIICGLAIRYEDPEFSTNNSHIE
jgi:hypothetical protein